MKTKKDKEQKSIGKLNKLLKSKMVSRQILKKPTRVTIHIKESEPAEYRSIFFKNTYENEKRKLLKD